MFYPGCPLLDVLSWMSSPGCPLLDVLSWLSCCPVQAVFVRCLAVLSVLSCPRCPVVTVLFALSCIGFPITAVLSRRSCSGCSIRLLLLLTISKRTYSLHQQNSVCIFRMYLRVHIHIYVNVRGPLLRLASPVSCLFMPVSMSGH
jgi:hypothetical protein